MFCKFSSHIIAKQLLNVNLFLEYFTFNVLVMQVEHCAFSNTITNIRLEGFVLFYLGKE